MSEYDAFLWADNVRCFGSTGGAGIVESCNGLADRMDVSDGRKSFGPRDLPHDYVIPYTLTTGKRKSALRYISLLLTYTDFSSTNNRCYLKITSHPDNLYTRTASWHRIWEYAILVNAMCIRAAKKGVFHVLAAGTSNIVFFWAKDH